MTTSHRTEDEWNAAAEWAEQVELPEPARHALRGQEAAAYGRAMMEAALGGAAEVERAIGGRPPLTPNAPVGHHARKRQVRLPTDLDAALDTRAAAEGRTASDILRAALTDYLTTHPAS